MPQSLHQVYGHIVFSIKDRENTITGDIEQKLYAYLGGIIRDLKGAPVLINGMPDHVHLLVRASKSITDIDFMRQLKGSSSKWLNENGLNGFRWQSGYGWFSVSAKDLPAARAYVEKQKEHHQEMTFKEEFRKFLTQYQVVYDERYVWD